jgi:hypothetical protein
MNRGWKILVSALLAAGVSAPLVADQEKTRFESSGFLKSLDAFIAEQMAKKRKDDVPDNSVALKELELSLRDKKHSDDNFFRLSDSRGIAPESLKYKNTGLSSRPDFSSLLAPTGQLKSAYGISETGGNSRLNLSFGRDKNNAESRGFEVSLESAYRFTIDGLPTSAVSADIGSANREYNVGVTLGYSGFGVDASMTRQTNVFERDLSGFAIGFSYQSKSWAARLSMSGYRQGADLFGIENDVRSIVSVELGASYRLTDSIGFKGGVRYYDYGDQWVVVDTEIGENSQMLFLGGQLKF